MRRSSISLFAPLLLCSLLSISSSFSLPREQEKSATKQETMVKEIEPKSVKEKLDKGEPFILVDVREQQEWDAGHIQGAWLMPLGSLDKRINELDRNREIIVYCRSGKRSEKAARILLESGFQNIQNMKGGILSWNDQVDASAPKN